MAIERESRNFASAVQIEMKLIVWTAVLSPVWPFNTTSSDLVPQHSDHNFHHEPKFHPQSLFLALSTPAPSRNAVLMLPTSPSTPRFAHSINVHPLGVPPNLRNAPINATSCTKIAACSAFQIFKSFGRILNRYTCNSKVEVKKPAFASRLRRISGVMVGSGK